MAGTQLSSGHIIPEKLRVCFDFIFKNYYSGFFCQMKHF
jgi:hypothetical protein